MQEPHPKVAGLTIDKVWYGKNEASKALAAGLEHWPQATLDVDAAVAAHEEELRAAIPEKVAKFRKEQEHLQSVRQLAAREGITIAEAAERMKRDAGDDDNVLASV